MPIVEVTIKFSVAADYIPPDIVFPPSEGYDPEVVSGAEQIAHDLLERLYQYLPDKAYAFVQAATVIPGAEIIAETPAS